MNKDISQYLRTNADTSIVPPRFANTQPTNTIYLNVGGQNGIVSLETALTELNFKKDNTQIIKDNSKLYAKRVAGTDYEVIIKHPSGEIAAQSASSKINFKPDTSITINVLVDGKRSIIPIGDKLRLSEGDEIEVAIKFFLEYFKDHNIQAARYSVPGYLNR